MNPLQESFRKHNDIFYNNNCNNNNNEICAMWKQNTAQVIPFVISSTGVIPSHYCKV